MDLSDGLGKDLPRLLQASQKGALIRRASIPRRRSADGFLVSVDAAWGDGEDFELLLAVKPGRVTELSAAAGVEFTVIGEVTDQGWVLQDEQGRSQPFPEGGYEHSFA